MKPKLNRPATLAAAHLLDRAFAEKQKAVENMRAAISEYLKNANACNLYSWEREEEIMDAVAAASGNKVNFWAILKRSNDRTERRGTAALEPTKTL